MSCRVLLVDDEPLVLSSLRRLLSRRDFDVSIATSGEEALTFLESETVDVIVSDYKMPGLNGIDFLSQVAPRWPDIQRCMLTAQADKEQLKEAIDNGLLHRAWTKPWNNQELVDELSELVTS